MSARAAISALPDPGAKGNAALWAVDCLIALGAPIRSCIAARLAIPRHRTGRRPGEWTGADPPNHKKGTGDGGSTGALFAMPPKRPGGNAAPGGKPGGWARLRVKVGKGAAGLYWRKPSVGSGSNPMGQGNPGGALFTLISMFFLCCARLYTYGARPRPCWGTRSSAALRPIVIPHGSSAQSNRKEAGDRGPIPILEVPKGPFDDPRLGRPMRRGWG